MISYKALTLKISNQTIYNEPSLYFFTLTSNKNSFSRNFSGFIWIKNSKRDKSKNRCYVRHVMISKKVKT